MLAKLKAEEDDVEKKRLAEERAKIEVSID